MKLLDRTGYKPDSYARANVAEIAGVERPLVPLEGLAAALAAANGEIGVEIPNTATVAVLEPHLPRLSLIAVAFPGFGDGRGFSIARRLRRAGFTGILRAAGPLIADQFAYALACGFDEIELPDASADRQPAAQWAKAEAIVTAGYQRGYQRGSILDQRRKARGTASDV